MGNARKMLARSNGVAEMNTAALSDPWFWFAIACILAPIIVAGVAHTCVMLRALRD